MGVSTMIGLMLLIADRSSSFGSFIWKSTFLSSGREWYLSNCVLLIVSKACKILKVYDTLKKRFWVIIFWIRFTQNGTIINTFSKRSLASSFLPFLMMWFVNFLRIIKQRYINNQCMLHIFNINMKCFLVLLPYLLSALINWDDVWSLSGGLHGRWTFFCTSPVVYSESNSSPRNVGWMKYFGNCDMPALKSEKISIMNYLLNIHQWFQTKRSLRNSFFSKQLSLHDKNIEFVLK